MDSNNYTSEIKKQFEEGKEVIIAGRLMSRRIQGKASFGQLQDGEGRIHERLNYINKQLKKDFMNLRAQVGKYNNKCSNMPQMQIMIKARLICNIGSILNV